MSLNQKEITKVVSELKVLISSARIEKISEISTDVFLFKLYSKEKYSLLLSLKPMETRLHITLHNWLSNSKNTSFQAYLRKYVQGKRIESINIVNEDRIVELKITSKEPSLYLIIELIEKSGNILILNEQKEILYHLKPLRANLEINKKYFPPEKKNYTVINIIPEEENLSYNQTIDDHYKHLLSNRTFKSDFDKLKSFLKKELKQSQKVSTNLEKQLTHCKTWQEWQQKGELLKGQLHLIIKGETEVILDNYYDESLSKIKISLNPEKPPSDNVELYFKKAKKLKNGLIVLNEKIEKAKLKLEKVKALYKPIENITGREQLDEFLKQNQNEHEIKRCISRISKPKVAKQAHSLPHHIFLSSKGKSIYVGKNSRNNDQLTFQVAKGNDLWLHTMDYPGSHIVIPLNKNEEIDQETLVDAVHLALIYSKAKSHLQGEVMYTKRKNLSKPKNAKPGEVQVSQFKSMFIHLDSKRIEEIKDRSRGLKD